MPTTAYQEKYAGTASGSWTNLSNAVGAPNGNYAYSYGTTNYTSPVIQLTNFGFTIPANATITEIIVTLTRWSTVEVSGSVRDSSLYLYYNSAAAGSNFGDTSTSWPSAPGSTKTYTLDSSAVSAAGITPAKANSASFGIGLSTYATTPYAGTAYGGTQAYCDAVLIHITYTVPSSPNAPSSLSPTGPAQKINPQVDNNFTFKYTHPDSLKCVSYRIGYKYGANDYTYLSPIAANAPSGTTLTYTLPANTFTLYGASYTWIAEVTDVNGKIAQAAAPVYTCSLPDAPVPTAPINNVFVNAHNALNFTFQYSHPTALDTSAYRVSYKKTTDASYTQTGWISNVTASGSIVTHTFPANTFSIDKNYQWYAEVKDSAGVASPASAVCTFNTNDNPVVAITSPLGGVNKNIRQDIRIDWSYSSPVGYEQAKYSLNLCVGDYSPDYLTGTVITSDHFCIIPADALMAYVGTSSIIHIQLTVYDTASNSTLAVAVSAFTAVRPYCATGEWISDVISNGGRDVPATVTYNADVPDGTTLTAYAHTSVDNVTWGDWAEITSGSAVAGDHRYIQVKFSMTPSADGFTTPTLNDVSIVYPDQYYATGEWVSNEVDCSELYDVMSELTKTETLNGGSIAYATRGKTDALGAWSDWDTGLVAGTSQLLQLKASIARGEPETRPSISALALSITSQNKQSVWISQTVDASRAKSLSSSKVVPVLSLNGGQAIIYSRSKPSGGSWSEWAVALYDGSLMHPVNPLVQVMAVLIGEAELQTLTLSFDGDAAVELLKDGLTPGAEYSFTTLNDLVLIANGDDPLMKWDALTAEPEQIVGAPVLSVITTHHNKAWGVDAEVPSRVRFSNVLDPTTWGDYDFIDFNPDDGDKITAIIRYGQNLVVSKLRSMALLTGNQSSNYNVSWLDSEAGATGKNAMCIADKYLVYVSQDGIRFTDLSQSIVATERLLPSWEHVNKRRLNQAACCYWNNRCFIALPSESSLYNDTVWVYDFLRNSWSVIEGWEVSCWRTFSQYGEEILLCGSSVTGQIYRADVTYYDDTVPVTFEWRSKNFDFKVPEKYKLFRNIFVDIEGVAETTNLEIDLIVDGVVTGTYRTTIPAGAGVKTTRRILPPLYGAVLGSAISLQVRGRCGIQSIVIEYAVRGNIPGGEV